jgi:serine/threonine-protein phosphatase CPPED1
MKTTKNFLILLAILLSTGISYAQKGNSSDSFFFIQMSDPQFGLIDPSTGFKQETALYEKAVQKINNLKPAFVVITGDFTQNHGDSKQIAEFKRITGIIDASIPVYLTPGNHDLGDSLNQKAINSYIADYGDTKFSFDYNGSHFIGFNSSIIKANTPGLEEAQFAWLEKELSSVTGSKNIILLCHHPFFTVSSDEADNNITIVTAIRNKYLDLFRKYRVNAIFAGHTHKNGYAKDGNMEMIITSAVGRPYGKDPSGFRIVKVYADRLESTFYGLDEVPAKVELEK